MGVNEEFHSKTLLFYEEKSQPDVQLLKALMIVKSLTNSFYFGMKLRPIRARVVNPVFCCLFYTDNVLSSGMVTTGTHRDFAVD